ncbi:MAG: hypothetical protein HOP19_25000 [Acidobacteria bacterium]|nr:hypothetical protein [Acidobacteriota bacterium]
MHVTATLTSFTVHQKSRLLWLSALGMALLSLSMAPWVKASWKSMLSYLPAVQSSGNDAPRISVLHFTLTPLGFNPPAATIPEGQYVIEVTNRSELNDFSLNLGRLSGHKLKETNKIKKHGEWRGAFNLKRGDFAIIINEKPEWAASIQVIKEDKR